MLGNCKKMVVTSSTTNEWPQIDDQKGLMAANPSRFMEKQPSQDQNQQQQQQQALKCPRCDSSNTKFCYYNNYSLSQPRHFCKACKRYWTRGGTLRNVPVGGGCRKNKRLKRPSNSSIDAPSSSSSIISLTPTTSTSNPSLNQHHIDLSSSTSNHVNPLFYGLPTSNHPSHELNLPYSRFNSRVLTVDLQPQLNALGLGFSSNENYPKGFNSNSLLSSYSSMFGSSSSSNSTSPSMASIIASSLQQQKFMSNGFHGLVPNETYQMVGPGEGSVVMKEGQNRLDWNVHDSQNQTTGQIGSSSDPSLYWNSTNVGAWLDPTNLGPSVPSLI